MEARSVDDYKVIYLISKFSINVWRQKVDRRNFQFFLNLFDWGECSISSSCCGEGGPLRFLPCPTPSLRGRSQRGVGGVLTGVVSKGLVSTGLVTTGLVLTGLVLTGLVLTGLLLTGLLLTGLVWTGLVSTGGVGRSRLDRRKIHCSAQCERV